MKVTGLMQQNLKMKQAIGEPPNYFYYKAKYAWINETLYRNYRDFENIQRLMKKIHRHYRMKDGSEANTYKRSLHFSWKWCDKKYVIHFWVRNEIDWVIASYCMLIGTENFILAFPVYKNSNDTTVQTSSIEPYIYTDKTEQWRKV